MTVYSISLNQLCTKPIRTDAAEGLKNLNSLIDIKIDKGFKSAQKIKGMRFQIGGRPTRPHRFNILDTVPPFSYSAQNNARYMLGVCTPPIWILYSGNILQLQSIKGRIPWRRIRIKPRSTQELFSCLVFSQINPNLQLNNQAPSLHWCGAVRHIILANQASPYLSKSGTTITLLLSENVLQMSLFSFSIC